MNEQRAALLDLADECAGETRINGELEREIARVLFGDPARAAAWTASVDAALTLVPHDHLWQAGVVDFNYATVWHRDERWDRHFAQAVTPELAICAAALRARAMLAK